MIKARQSIFRKLQGKGFSEQEMLELMGWTSEELVKIQKTLAKC